MATYAPTVITRNTKQALPVPGANAYAVASAWAFIQDYACTGFGGSITVSPWSGTDPLPSPNPLP